MSVVLTNAATGDKFCIRLYSLVLPKLLMGMFIGRGSACHIASQGYGENLITWGFDFGTGERIEVKYEDRY